MPDEEVLEDGVLNPVKPEIQDPLLRALLADEPAATPAPADTPQEQPQALPTEADEVDCVVIGLGAGGAPLLARLAMAGLRVVALEAGPWHNPEKDFATDERAQDFLFWNDERLSAGQDPLAMGRNNSGTGVAVPRCTTPPTRPARCPPTCTSSATLAGARTGRWATTNWSRITKSWSGSWAFRGPRPTRGARPGAPATRWRRCR